MKIVSGKVIFSIHFSISKVFQVFVFLAGEYDIDEDEIENEDQTMNAKTRKTSVGNEARFDKFDHWVEHDENKSGSRCKYNKCNKTIHTYCSKCGVYLCSLRGRNCFKQYHHE